MHRYCRYHNMTQEIIALTDWKLEVFLTQHSGKKKTEYLKRSQSKGKMLFRRILKTLKQHGLELG